MKWNRGTRSSTDWRGAGVATSAVQIFSSYPKTLNTLKVSNRLIAQCADPVVATTIDSLDNRSDKDHLKRPSSI